jgi:hypothetical protein
LGASGDAITSMATVVTDELGMSATLTSRIVLVLELG